MGKGDDRSVKLIDCFETVEMQFAELMQKEDGNFLYRNIGELFHHPERVVTELGGAFKPLVDPILLNTFMGNWMAFLLWNNLSKSYHLLYDYRSHRISKERYLFIGGFLDSEQFQEKGFIEPMTEIIFQDHTKNKVLVFTWSRDKQRPLNIKRGFPEEIAPVVISFDPLNDLPDITDLFEDLDRFISLNCYKVENREAIFGQLASRIQLLSERILTHPKGQRLFEDAAEKIDRNYRTVDGDKENKIITPELLCRSLIWNRFFDEKWQSLYYIPARFLEKNAVSGIVCAFDDFLKEREYFVLTQIVNRVFSIFHFALYRQEYVLYALRSTIAAIMSRNMSHNIGSHSLAYLTNDIRNKIEQQEPIDEYEAEDAVKLIEYLKARMDYLAEITNYWRENPWLNQLT